MNEIKAMGVARLIVKQILAIQSQPYADTPTETIEPHTRPPVNAIPIELTGKNTADRVTDSMEPVMKQTFRSSRMLLSGLTISFGSTGPLKAITRNIANIARGPVITAATSPARAPNPAEPPAILAILIVAPPPNPVQRFDCIT
jgi:hypothetical protein